MGEDAPLHHENRACRAARQDFICPFEITNRGQCKSLMEIAKGFKPLGIRHRVKIGQRVGHPPLAHLGPGGDQPDHKIADRATSIYGGQDCGIVLLLCMIGQEGDCGQLVRLAAQRLQPARRFDGQREITGAKFCQDRAFQKPGITRVRQHCLPIPARCRLKVVPGLCHACGKIGTCIFRLQGHAYGCGQGKRSQKAGGVGHAVSPKD